MDLIADELANRLMGLPGRLKLRHVSAVELQVARARQGLLHVHAEADGDECLTRRTHYDETLAWATTHQPYPAGTDPQIGQESD